MLVSRLRSLTRHQLRVAYRLSKMSTLTPADCEIAQDNSCVIAACQMTSTGNREDNFTTGSHLIERAAKLSAKERLLSVM